MLEPPADQGVQTSFRNRISTKNSLNNSLNVSLNDYESKGEQSLHLIDYRQVKNQRKNALMSRRNNKSSIATSVTRPEKLGIKAFIEENKKNFQSVQSHKRGRELAKTIIREKQLAKTPLGICSSDQKKVEARSWKPKFGEQHKAPEFDKDYQMYQDNVYSLNYPTSRLSQVS